MQQLRRAFARFKAGIVKRLLAPTANAAVDDVREFQSWLRQHSAQTLPHEEMWRKFAQAGYRKGVGRAFDDARKQRPGESSDFYAGGKDQFLRSSFGQPVAADKVRLMASRSFDEMKNLESDTLTRMSRVLTDGLVNGDSPRDIASDLADECDVSVKRAETIARTEIVRCHAEGQLDALEDMGVDEVGVEVEFSATGDGGECQECASLAGSVFGIDEARGMIPVHPNCRCAWIPALPTDNAYNPEQARGSDGKFASALGMPKGKHTPEGMQKLVEHLQKETGLKYKPHGSVAQGKTSDNDLDVIEVPQSEEEQEKAYYESQKQESAAWERVNKGEMSKDELFKQFYDTSKPPTDAAMAKLGFKPTKLMAFGEVYVTRYEDKRNKHTVEVWSHNPGGGAPGDTTTWHSEDLTGNVAVPDVRQRKDYDCGAAAVQSALLAVGLKLPYERVLELLGTNEKDGTTVESVVRVLKALGVYSHEVHGLVELRAALAGAVVCAVQQSGRSFSQGHYVVVTDASDEWVHVQDPVSGADRVRTHEWVQRWHDKDTDGRVYYEHGVALLPVAANAAADQPRDEHGRWEQLPSGHTLRPVKDEHGARWAVHSPTGEHIRTVKLKKVAREIAESGSTAGAPSAAAAELPTAAGLGASIAKHVETSDPKHGGLSFKVLHEKLTAEHGNVPVEAMHKVLLDMEAAGKVSFQEVTRHESGMLHTPYTIKRYWNDKWQRYDSELGYAVRNAFCPTGAGGGQDNSCGSSKFVGQLVGKAEHMHAANVEKEVAKAVGGKWSEDNEAHDVLKGDNGIEVKSLLKGTKQSLSVHPDALMRKVMWEQDKPGRTFHTVAVDERATYDSGAHSDNYSGNRLYYKRGSGRYSLSQMHPVQSAAELKRLMNTPMDQLPERAKGGLPTDTKALTEAATKAHDARLAKDRARKERLRASR